ncbi:hypothetical protein A3H38_02145 [candidate division WOR-1 bacterium RIFCSPLOWO2_02_FULL_46_20]|uniref:CBM11 domain-containing protein n=1 Tax=candidate division WOR-1 bacterium RIFCSPLOWO2_02_FULL_46_20 TaxID=1802567 RepID=A0A1F4R8G2_UNCSA|nr:MAG: hypothetical protein A3H38_02145 [candidate division WOR-1 bacterium RIFCSPLOWO2_02_FULL_46_20]
MKKFIVGGLMLFGFCLLIVSLAGAMGGPAAEKTELEESKPIVLGPSFLIEDFESGSLRSPREWWTFDVKRADVVGNDKYAEGEEVVTGDVGKYSLMLKGKAANWYVGGCGSYLAKEGQNLSKHDTFVLDVYGNGKGSGTLKVELFDDDNGNYQVEQDPAKNYLPIYDDKLVYDVVVDWEGWKRVEIPLNDFVDDNSGTGDDVWNPQQENASGGFLQFQFVCIAAGEDAEINFNLDNIKLTVNGE